MKNYNFYKLYTLYSRYEIKNLINNFIAPLPYCIY